MVYATSILYYTGVVATVLLLDHGHGNGAAELVHAGHDDAGQGGEVSALVLLLES